LEWVIVRVLRIGQAVMGKAQAGAWAPRLPKACSHGRRARGVMFSGAGHGRADGGTGPFAQTASETRPADPSAARGR